MDTFLLRVFQAHVVHCCNSVIFGAEEIGNDTYNANRLWYGVQNVVTGAGNLSKAFWGAGDSRIAERQPLRNSLTVSDASPLRRVVQIRNDYEHLDERIEQWWNASPEHNLVQQLIGPRGSISGLDEKEMLRWFDPTTGDVIFWGHEMSIPAVLEEARRILPVAEAECAKPHWNVNQNASGGGG